MSFNPHYPILFLLLFSLLCNANAIPIDDKQNGQKKRHIGHNDVEILIMYGLDLVILQLGILCTLYMIIRTFIRWYKHDLSLHMSHKLPFYMALSDFFIYVALTINLYYPAITGHQWPGQSCKIVALGFYYSALFNMILVGSLALVSYFRVCKAMIINTGILDYKLFIFPIFIPAILSIPAWQYFGPNDGYWCLRSRKSSIIPLVLLYVEIFILLTSLFCYIGISHAINVSRFRNDEENFRTSNRKIVSYIFMYILQWTPVMIFIIIGMEHPANMWVFAVCIISLPAGGILNTYRYVSNEGFWNIGSEDNNGQDPSLRNRTNLHSIKNFGGPPTVSQWRELSGEDVEDQRSSDQSQELQNESQDQIQIQLQNVQNESQDQIQSESQDQIQIQLQSESQGQNIQSQDDKIQP